MNNRPLVRKIIYIACIGVLIIPLSMIALPPTRNEAGNVQGGVISQLRDKNNLSQAKLSEIDPASETMKLASLGLRGVAVNILWYQAGKYKKEQNYDQMQATLRALTKIQPSFVKVWEYQAHNLAYNVSMEFDDYEYRYSWVKKGLEFLKQGVPYNKRDHRVTDSIGFFTGNKFGKSDEHLSFRRLFRADDEFHEAMSDRIDPEDYEGPYGHDSWLMAYQWYDISRDLVDGQGAPRYRSDMMFYMFRPAQRRNYGMALQEEFPSDQIIQEVYRDAYEEWIDYGNQPLSNAAGASFTLEGLAAAEDELAEYRKQLDELVGPEVRASMVTELGEDLLSEEEQLLVNAPLDQLSPDDARRAQEIKSRLADLDERLDGRVALASTLDDRAEANRIALKIQGAKNKIRRITQDAQTVNYQYWRTRNRTESEDATVVAHQALEEAESVWRNSVYDDEYDFNYRTKEKTVTRKGAITLFEEAFALWAPILKENPGLDDGQLADSLMDSVKEYAKMLAFANREWPDDFPLQFLIDQRAQDGGLEGIPTTEIIERRKADREAIEGEETEAAKPETKADDSPPANESSDGESAEPEVDDADKEQTGGTEDDGKSGEQANSESSESTSGQSNESGSNESESEAPPVGSGSGGGLAA